MEAPACVDCYFYKYDTLKVKVQKKFWFFRWKVIETQQKHMCHWYREDRDLITGNMLRKSYVSTCREQRSYDGMCERKGKLFKRKSHAIEEVLNEEK